MATFRELHGGPDLLRLPNAWDAGSARLIESLGAKAIATTSAGLAWSRGYPDGDALPAEKHDQVNAEMLAAIRRYVDGSTVNVPAKFIAATGVR